MPTMPAAAATALSRTCGPALGAAASPDDTDVGAELDAEEAEDEAGADVEPVLVELEPLLLLVAVVFNVVDRLKLALVVEALADAGVDWLPKLVDAAAARSDDTRGAMADSADFS